MAKLYFYYSAMNAGKSTVLLQTRYNYEERGMHPLLFIAQLVVEKKKSEIRSRIDLRAPAISFDQKFSFLEYVKKWQEKNPKNIACLLVDEAHFLTKKQVEEITDIVDKLNIPVLTYGLRTDFLGNLFEGSYYLLAWAENIKEIKNICHCGNKAIMNMRIDTNGKKYEEGPQVQVGGNESYVATCRYHFKTGEAVPFL